MEVRTGGRCVAGLPSVVIVVPVLRRPHRVAPLVESVQVSTPSLHRLLFVASPNDDDEHAELDRCGVEWVCMDASYEGRGDYARKINLGYRITDDPLIFCGADDLKFHRFWLERAYEKMLPGIGVVGTNDLGNPRVMAGYHATHPLVSRVYADLGTVDQPRSIYCEEYRHQFCDDECIKTAKARKAYTFALDSYVEHLHPNWKDLPTDPVYKMAEPWLEEGRELFLRRQHLWKRRLTPFREVVCVPA